MMKMFEIKSTFKIFPYIKIPLWNFDLIYFFLLLLFCFVFLITKPGLKNYFNNLTNCLKYFEDGEFLKIKITISLIAGYLFWLVLRNNMRLVKHFFILN